MHVEIGRRACVHAVIVDKLLEHGYYAPATEPMLPPPLTIDEFVFSRELRILRYREDRDRDRDRGIVLSVPSSRTVLGRTVISSGISRGRNGSYGMSSTVRQHYNCHRTECKKIPNVCNHVMDPILPGMPRPHTMPKTVYDVLIKIPPPEHPICALEVGVLHVHVSWTDRLTISIVVVRFAVVPSRRGDRGHGLRGVLDPQVWG